MSDHKTDRIHNLTRDLEAARSALQSEQARNRVLTDGVLVAVEESRLRTLAAGYGQFGDTNDPTLFVLLSALQLGLDAQDPLRSAPMSDTSRVGHPDDTPTEAAYFAMHQARANVQWAGEELESLAKRIRDRLQPGFDFKHKDDKPQRPRCHGAHCRGKRGNVGDRFCRNCGKAFNAEEEAA